MAAIVAIPLSNDFSETSISFTDIKDGVVGVDLVVEAATENVELKLNIFKQLNEACSHNTILATNTSSISITQIGAVVAHPERVIGMHFMNPVPIMKLVEIIRVYNTWIIVYFNWSFS